MEFLEKIRTTTQPSNSTPGYFSRENKDSKKEITHPTEALFTSKIWKQPECPLIDEWIKKMVYTQIHWNIVIKKKRMKPYHLQQHVWRVLC